MIDFNELIFEAHENAVLHGWHEEEHSPEHFMCLVVAELMEAVDADRNGRKANIGVFRSHLREVVNNIPDEKQRDEAWKLAFEDCIKDTVGDELADAAIRLFDFCGATCNFIRHDYQYIVSREWPAVESGQLSFTETIFYIAKKCVQMEYEWVLICIFALAKHEDIDLLWHIEQKMRYNTLRPYKHGNKKY